MAEIEVRPVGRDVYEVTVRDERSASVHRVVATAATVDELVPGGDAVRLVHESFRFLLEREPKESVLASFELPVIARYFPEYPDEIRRRLS